MQSRFKRKHYQKSSLKWPFILLVTWFRVYIHSTTVTETLLTPPLVKLNLLSTLRPSTLLLLSELLPLEGTMDGSLGLLRLCRDERPLLRGASSSSPSVLPSSFLSPSSATVTPRGGGGKNDRSMSLSTDWLMVAEV